MAAKNRLLTIPQAAEMLSVSNRKLYEMADAARSNAFGSAA